VKSTKIQEQLNKLPVPTESGSSSEGNELDLLNKLNFLESELKKMEDMHKELSTENENLQREYDDEVSELITLNEKMGGKLDMLMNSLDVKAKIKEKLESGMATNKERDEDLDKLCKDLDAETDMLTREYQRLIEEKQRIDKEIKDTANSEDS